VNSVLLGELQQLVSTHGYWVVALIVGLESMGLPLPGETILVLAAIYAATEPNFNVGVVIAVAALGAIVGDNAGYWLGLRYGYALLLRYGERIGRNDPRTRCHLCRDRTQLQRWGGDCGRRIRRDRWRQRRAIPYFPAPR